jgi:putative endonuclease
MIRVFTSPTQALGAKGEEVAVGWLTAQGFKVVERNAAGKYGEIDIVAKKGKVWHFFEVKAGKAGSWFNPAENLTPAKLKKFILTVEHYVASRQIGEYRVQGIVVRLGEKGDVDSIESIELT